MFGDKQVTKPSVCLFPLWVKADGVSMTWGPGDMFRTFYSIDSVEVDQHLGLSETRALRRRNSPPGRMG